MNTWWSFLLVTSDGGRSWKQARHAPSLADADLLLVKANEGWLFGLSEDSPFKVLSVTRDGANSWQTVTLEAPKEIASANCSVMDLPTFEDARHGFLHVNCLTGEPPESKLAMVLFATEDGGRTWRKNRPLVGVILISSRSLRALQLISAPMLPTLAHLTVGPMKLALPRQLRAGP